MTPRKTTKTEAAEATETPAEPVVEDAAETPAEAPAEADAPETTDEVVEEAAPVASSPAAQMLATWTGLSPRLYRQDAKVLDLLTEHGPMTEAAIREKFSDLSSWTFRRMATGVHHKREEGVPVIRRVSVDGSKGWELTPEAAAYEAPVEEPAEESVAS